MAELTLATGAVIDVATREDVRKLDDRLKGIIQGLRPVLPRKIAATFTTPSSPPTYTFIDAGSPRLNGRVWDVRRLSVMTQDPFSSQTATVLLFIASAAPVNTSNEPTFTDMIDAPQTLNSASFGDWGSGQLSVLGTEHLLVCIKSAPASTQINVFGQVEEWDVAEAVNIVV